MAGTPARNGPSVPVVRRIGPRGGLERQQLRTARLLGPRDLLLITPCAEQITPCAEQITCCAEQVTRCAEQITPRRGGECWGRRFPRVALRVAVAPRGGRSIRGYMPEPRWGSFRLRAAIGPSRSVLRSLFSILFSASLSLCVHVCLKRALRVLRDSSAGSAFSSPGPQSLLCP